MTLNYWFAPTKERVKFYSFNPQRYATLLSLLDDRALHQAEQTAYIFLESGETESASITYQQLQLQARAIAARLQQVVKLGDRALLLYPSGLEFIAAFFGCLYAGVIAVPAYPPRRNQNLERLQSIVSDCQATITLTTTSLLPNLEVSLDQDSELVSLKRLSTDNIEADLAETWQQLDVNTLAFLQYTSGSTGKPKGVMVTHKNLMANLKYIRQAFELTSESVSVTWLPSFHDMGLIDGVLQPLYSGFLGVLMPPVAFLQKPSRWLQAIAHYGATHSGGPNFGYDLCLNKITAEQRADLDLSSWMSAYSGAEPIRQATLDQFHKVFQSCGFQPHFFYPCYGMAEATLMISGGRVEDKPSYLTVVAEQLEQGQVVEGQADSQAVVRQIVGCGRSWLDMNIIIADPKTQTQCPAGRVGEIWVSGSSVTQGYWNQPEKTAETFEAYLITGEGPFLRTGDLGFLQEDGELFVTGRLKDIIIIRGRNHYPQDIELTVEKSHKALVSSHSAAFAIEEGGEEKLVVMAEVVRHPGHSLLKTENVSSKIPVFEEIFASIQQSVTKNHGLQVHAVCLLRFGSIPKTSSGKIQRHACRNGFLNSQNLNLVWQSR